MLSKSIPVKGINPPFGLPKHTGLKIKKGDKLIIKKQGSSPWVLPEKLEYELVLDN